MFSKIFNNNPPLLSKKGKELIKLYEKMITEGYFKKVNDKIVKIKKDKGFEQFLIRKHRHEILNILSSFEISSLLDYGSGGCDWEENGFHNQLSAKKFFNLDEVVTFEPSRKKNFIKKLDCIISFDVLEHVYINDLKKVISTIYKNAKKLVIIRVATTEAGALLPNGENAHITVRPPIWWKGYLDAISVDYPNITTYLYCDVASKTISTSWKNLSYDQKKEYKIDL